MSQVNNEWPCLPLGPIKTMEILGLALSNVVLAEN